MIPLTNPIVIPPTSGSVAEQLFICTANVDATNGPSQPIKLYLNVAPLVSATGEVLTDQSQDILIPDLSATVSNNPTLGTALSAVYTAVGYLCQVQGLFGMSLPTSGSNGN